MSEEECPECEKSEAELTELEEYECIPIKEKTKKLKTEKPVEGPT